MPKALLFYLDDDAHPWAAIEDHGEPFSIRIGRSPDNDIAIPLSVPQHVRNTVSRVHARIFANRGQVWIEDLGSNNFTFLGGRVLIGPKQLRFPCSVRLGKQKIRIESGELSRRQLRKYSSEGLEKPLSNESAGTLTGSLSVSLDNHYLRELQTRLRWVAAIVDVAEIVSRGCSARRIENLLETTLQTHFNAEHFELVLDLALADFSDLLSTAHVQPTARTKIEKGIATLKESKPFTRVVDPESNLVAWVLLNPSTMKGTLSAIVMQTNADNRAIAETEEADAVVVIALKMATAVVHATRRFESLEASVHESVSHEPSDRFANFCRGMGIWGSSPAYRQSIYAAEQAATRYLSMAMPSGKLSGVFILGETGTGKSSLAEVIHKTSNHKDGQFQALNCANVPVELAESELFGYEKGAHATAFARKAGFFESANGGTIFLDEIGKTSTAFQSKLLKVLDTGRFTPLGSTSQQRTNCHVILAASEDPAELIKDGQLLAELWFRVGAFTISMPPLRDRGDDIVYIVDQQLERFNNAQSPSRPKSLSEDARSLVFQYSWPGNVRELIECLRVAYAMTPEDSEIIDVDCLPVHVRGGRDRIPAPSPTIISRPLSTLDQFTAEREREYLARIINECGGNLSEAARRAGRSYPALHARVKEFRAWARECNDSSAVAERAILQQLAGSQWHVIEKE
ncbi:MAG: hypothetical protein AMXMBFR84_32930 [Candidatus Hydrogenedentota bacterium]